VLLQFKLMFGGDGADTTATRAGALLLEGTQAADPSCVMCGSSTPLTAPGRCSYSRRASGTCPRSLPSALSSRYTPGLARSAGCAACALRGHRCLKCANDANSLLVQAPVFFVDSDGTQQQFSPKLHAAACTQSPPPPPPPDPCPACVTGQEFGVCTAAINAECCDEPTEDCSSGEPAVCNAGCAAVLVPANQYVFDGYAPHRMLTEMQDCSRVRDRCAGNAKQGFCPTLAWMGQGMR
jgi:hypothetical protein